MKIEIKKLPKSKTSLIIFLDDGDMKKYVKQAVEDFIGNVEIKGFRRGKAPRDLVIQHIGQGHIDEKSVNIAVNDSYGKAIAENNINVVGYPDIEITKFVPNQELEYKAEVAIFPEVALPDYEKIAHRAGIKDRQEIAVEEKEIEEALNWLIKSRSKYDKVQRPSQEGDLVSTTYKINLDKSGEKEEENSEQKKDSFILGENKSIPGFDAQIIGLSPDEEKEFSLDVPGDFYDKEIAGKKIDIKIKINEVFKKDSPKLDDDFAKSLGGFQNLEELKNNIKENILLEKTQKEKERFKAVLISKIAEESKIDIPDAMIDSEIDKIIHEFRHNIEHRGMDFSKYLEHIKKTEDDLGKDFHNTAVERLKAMMVINEIAKKENIKVEEKKISEKSEEILNSLKAENKIKVDSVKLRNYVLDILTNEKVIEILEKLAS